jgi:uncharacterized linocin/CFP29 family protein
MNGSLGRDRVWNDHIWTEIDKAVREEVGRVRVAQKVFPSTVVNNVLPVSMNRAMPFVGTGSPAEPVDDVFQPFFEISTEFVLTQAQVEGEESLHLALSRARMAASALANAEDTILFLGPGFDLPGVNVTNYGAIPPGFVDEAAVHYLRAKKDPDLAKRFRFSDVKEAELDYVGKIIGAVSDGMGLLNSRGQPGPYALFLSPDRYAQSFAPAEKGHLSGPGDQISRIATGGFNMVSSLAVDNLKPWLDKESKKESKTFLTVVGTHRNLPPDISDIGLLVSLGGEPVKIILGSDATTAFTHTEAGKYHFRVFERIQMVVRDGTAFQILKFPANKGSSNAGKSQGGNAAGK